MTTLWYLGWRGSHQYHRSSNRSHRTVTKLLVPILGLLLSLEILVRTALLRPTVTDHIDESPLLWRLINSRHDWRRRSSTSATIRAVYDRQSRVLSLFGTMDTTHNGIAGTVTGIANTANGCAAVGRRLSESTIVVWTRLDSTRIV